MSGGSLGARLGPYRARRLARAAVLAGAAAAAVALAALASWRAVAALWPVPVPGGTTALGVATCAALIAAAVTAARAPRVLDLARALDRQLRTAECLATALEWEERGRTDAFAPLLARDAHAVLDAHPAAACDEPLDARRVRVVAALAVIAPFAWLLPVVPRGGEAPPELVPAAAVEAMLAPLSELAREAARQQLPRAERETREAAELVDAWRKRPPEKRAALDALSRRLERARAARPPAGRGLAQALSHALSQSPLTREAAARAREGDMAAAARSVEAALKEASRRRRTLEEDRQVERLVKQLAQALRDAAAPGGEDAQEEGDAETSLDRSAEDARIEERRGRDVALWELAEQLAKMDPKDLAQVASGAGKALAAGEKMKVAQLDRAALEKLVKRLREGKQLASGEGEGGERAGVQIGMRVPGSAGEKSGQDGASSGAGSGASPDPGASPGAGGGSGHEKGAGGAGGDVVTPFDKSALDGKPQPLAAPSAAAVSGARLAVRGAPGAMSGAEVSRVRQAPQVTQGPHAAASAEAGSAAGPADETVERESVPRRRQGLVRKWFDTR